MPFLANHLDFGKLEARNIRAHQLGAAPSTPVTGQLYYNTADNTLYWWDGTTWVAARGTSASGPAGGDLTGTYPNPQIAAGVITDADVNALNKDGAAGTPSLRTLGTGAAQAAPGNDARFGAPAPPNGAAGGDLAGTYPNPTVAPLAVTDAKVAAANKDGGAAVPSMRTLGTGAAQAAAGNDSRFTDARPPNGAAGGDLSGTFPNPQIAAGVIVDADVAAANKDGLVAVPSLRTLGAGAQQAMPGNRTLDAVTAPAADVAFNNHKATGLLDPTAAQDAATKSYVDTTAQGLDAKASVRAASTGNLTLSAPQTVDGVALVAGDRVLVKDQTTPAQNGIYVVAAGAWVRATDTDTWNELVSAFTFVESGTVNADSGWTCTVDPGGTLNTTPAPWAQFSGAGQVTAGAGLVKSGNVVDVGQGAGIAVAADTVAVATGGVTNAMLAGAIDVTTKLTGAVPIANGGTGQTAQKAARETGIAAAGYYSSATHGAGTTIAITAATHGLRASRGLIVQVQEEATGVVVIPDIAINATGDVTVTFGASVTANAYRVTVIG